MKTVIALCLSLSTGLVSAQDSWKHASSSTDGKLHVEVKNVRKTPKNIEAISRWTDEDGIQFYVLSISQADCKAGYGTLFYREVDGSKQLRGPYVSDGGTVFSYVADHLCTFNSTPKR
jgi:hypothetical protein